MRLQPRRGLVPVRAFPQPAEFAFCVHSSTLAEGTKVSSTGACKDCGRRTLGVQASKRNPCGPFYLAAAFAFAFGLASFADQLKACCEALKALAACSMACLESSCPVW
jgi:hypothetical protein